MEPCLGVLRTMAACQSMPAAQVPEQLRLLVTHMSYACHYDIACAGPAVNSRWLDNLSASSGWKVCNGVDAFSSVCRSRDRGLSATNRRGSRTVLAEVSPGAYFRVSVRDMPQQFSLRLVRGDTI